MNSELETDPILPEEIKRLYQIQIRRDWMIVILLWLTVGLVSIWMIRADLALWLEYFTWAAVRATIIYNRIAALGICLCIGFTLTMLFSQSQVIIFGISQRDKYRLEQEVKKIKQLGSTHPLWKKVVVTGD